MQFLPIIQRELRVGARHPRTWWRRVITMVIALVILGCTWLAVGNNRSLSSFGGDLFVALTVFGFLYALLAGPFATADCLSRERREGTLGLLFLTDLRSYDIVLGKTAAASLDLFLGLMAALPVLAMPLLAGGVTLEQFGRVVLLLADTLFLSLAAGTFASSLLGSGRASLGFTLVLLFLLTVGLPVFGEEVLRISVRSKLAPYLYMFCPLWTLSLSISPGFRGMTGTNFWLGTAGMHGLAWMLLLVACLRTSRFWREVPESRFVSWCRASFARLSQLQGSARRAWRRALLEKNPVAWLEERDHIQARILAGLLAGCAIFWAVQHLRSPTRWPDNDWLILWPMWSHYILCVWIAIQAPRRLADDRQSGALELLLCTGISVPQIIHGLLSVLRRRFGRAMFALMALDAFLVYAYTSNLPAGRRLDEELILLCFWATIVLPLQGYAFAYVGLYQGLLKGNSLKATFHLIFTLGLLPWGLFLMWIFLAEYSRRFIGGFPRVNAAFAFGSWATAHLLVFTAFLSWSGYRLHRHFRLLAAINTSPWWRRLLEMTTATRRV